MLPRQRKLSLEFLEGRALLATGEIDLTFGQNGQVSTEFNDSAILSKRAYGIAAQSNGSIVTVGEGAIVRYLPNGTIDTSFGNAGRVPFPGYARGISMSSNDSFLVFGGTSETSSTEMRIARYVSDGTLDPSFDTDGIANIPFLAGYTSAHAITTQANGRIVLVGVTNGQAAAARLLPSGALDSSFDGDGKWVRDFGGYSVANGVSLQADGKIIVVGTGRDVGSFQQSSLIVRLRVNGALDNTFYSTGFRVSPIGASSSNFGVTVQPDGKIVTTGYTRYFFNDLFAIARYLPNGDFDQTFGFGGYRTFGANAYNSTAPIGNSVIITESGAILSQANSIIHRFTTDGILDTTFGLGGSVTLPIYSQSIVLRPDGRVLVAGSTGTAYATAQLLPNGALDPSYSTEGIAIADLGPGLERVAGSTQQADGKLVVAGYSVNQFQVARYDANGNLDTTFSEDGRVTIDFGGEAWDAKANDVVVQPDGRILVVGGIRAWNGVYLSSRIAMARLMPDGSLDTTFSSDGLMTFDHQGFGGANAVALQTNGRIVVATSTLGNFFGVIRFLANGAIDNTFSGDGIAYIYSASGYSEAFDLVVQPDNKILVVGCYYMANSQRYGSAIMMARFNPNGGFDTTFAANGRRVDGSQIQRTGEFLALKADGSFLVAGNATETVQGGYSSHMAVTHYDALGNVQSPFTLQVIRHETMAYSDFIPSRFNSTTRGLVVQPDGKVLLLGLANNQAVVTRFMADGQRDSSFAGDGKAEISIGTGNLDPADLLLQANGKIIVVGSLTTTSVQPQDGDWVMTRLTQSTAPAASTLVRRTPSGQIEVVDAWDRDDLWEWSRQGDSFVLRELTNNTYPSFQVLGLPEITLLSPREISIPASLLEASNRPILLQSKGGNDQLRLAGSQDSTPLHGLIYVGGIGTDQLMNMSTLAATWTFASQGNGNLVLDGQSAKQFSLVESFVGGTNVDIFRINPTVNAGLLKIDGGDDSAIDTLQITADANMRITQSVTTYNPEQATFFKAYRLLVEGSIGQTLAFRDINQLTLRGGASANVLNVSNFEGASTLYGGGGDDELHAALGDSFLYGEAGNDLLFGDRGHDQLWGGTGNDLLNGYYGNDLLEGGDGRDILVGGGDSDILNGGTGDDLLHGSYLAYADPSTSPTIRNAFLARWFANETYNTRTFNILNGVGGGPVTTGQNSFRDGFLDTLNGQGGRDWFFASNHSTEDELAASLADLATNELITLL